MPCIISISLDSLVSALSISATAVAVPSSSASSSSSSSSSTVSIMIIKTEEPRSKQQRAAWVAASIGFTPHPLTVESKGLYCSLHIEMNRLFIYCQSVGVNRKYKAPKLITKINETWWLMEPSADIDVFVHQKARSTWHWFRFAKLLRFFFRSSPTHSGLLQKNLWLFKK